MIDLNDQCYYSKETERERADLIPKPIVARKGNLDLDGSGGAEWGHIVAFQVCSGITQISSTQWNSLYAHTQEDAFLVYIASLYQG